MITRSDPFREALSLRRAMDQLFEQSFIQPSLMSGLTAQIAPMDVCETPDGYEVDIALPGVRPEDIELTVDVNTVTIRGRFSYQNEHQEQQKAEKQEAERPSMRHPKGHNWLSREIPSGTFERTITLPRPVDTNNIQTRFENGVLTVLLPVTEASRPKRVSITSGQAQPQQLPVGAGTGGRQPQRQ